jgi:Fungal specific transcription factor domain
MVHRARYLAAMNLPEGARPPVSLRYAIWTLAASVTDKYFNLQSHFYDRARKYLEETEMKGHGECLISVAYAQAWILIAIYEFKLMFFPRAWMSTGRAIRLAQMMGLHRLDGIGLEVKQCLLPPRDWTEKEERRRTFWLSFCIDRYASIGTGWPLTIEEKDVSHGLKQQFISFRPRV